MRRDSCCKTTEDIFIDFIELAPLNLRLDS